jgi:nanoRNase/pAp phosphatase (c-di-AMP/oligoRNAs hydrolase)
MSAKTRIKPQPDRKYRLITRSDMDGLVCAVLLKTIGLIEDVTFAHPKDMQDGLVKVGDGDITTNLPYVEGVFLAFDHHASEVARIGTSHANHVIDPAAPSAARVVYDYFGGAECFPDISADLMEAVDKADSANFTKEDILNPQGWVLLSFLMDARTGLGRFRDFNISNYQLMMQLVDTCRERKNISEILALPDVRERVDLYFEHQLRFREQIQRCATVHGPLAILDLRQEETIWAGNRFMIYALFPQCNVSCHVLWGKNRQNTVLAVGKSILNRTCPVHVGNLMLRYGGGGHEAAGTCQVPNLQTEEKIQELIATLTANA